MTDWTKPMQQTFEYYLVDPGTWKDVRPITTVVSSTISRDSSAETLGSLSINIGESIGEAYVRVYLITVQNGIKNKYPLGTFIVQTPTTSFDGKVRTTTMDAYTPLLELKDGMPPLGYSMLKGENILNRAYTLVRDNVRAPVSTVETDDELVYDFVANTNDTWLIFIRDLMANAKYELTLDEMGRILFAPIQEAQALSPKWTFDNSNSSILQPAIDIQHDLYGIPNVVEVIFSNGKDYFYAKAVNDDPNSPTSTISRGREILYRDNNPNTLGNPTEGQINRYAQTLLKALSSLEYSITYTHGYCPVGLGDCVRLNYPEAGLNNVKAKIVKQKIDCKPGCQVTETAIFTNQLWG